jgi:hypothetical protein
MMLAAAVPWTAFFQPGGVDSQVSKLHSQSGVNEVLADIVL